MVLAGLATYALARDCGLRRWASLVAALMFAAGPQLAFRYGGEHLNLAMAFWIPLLLLFVRRWLGQPTTRRAAVCALTLAGALYTDFTIAIFSVMLSGAYLVCVAMARPRRVRSAFVLRRIGAASALLAVVLIPLAIALVDAARSGAFGTGGLGGSPYYGNDLWGLIVPNLRIEGPGHLGLAATGLALLALIADRLRTPLVAWLTLVVIACAWLSLGPHLVINGVRFVPFPIHMDDSGLPVSAVMPFTWVQSVFHDLRVPQRFLLLGSVPLALLAGMGAQAVWLRFPRIAIVVCAAAVCLLLVEARTPPGESVPFEPPSVYDSVTGAADDSTIVVDVPLGMRTGFVQVGIQLGAPLIYAAQHEHPVSNGFFSRLPEAAQDEWAAIPLYRDLLALQQTGSDAPDPAVDPREGYASAVRYHVDFVVLHGATSESVRIREYLAAACFVPLAAGETQGFRLEACPAAGGNH
jgi:hypothetical protein